MTQSTSSQRRVVLTGMGAVTPLGPTMPTTWQGITEGRSVAGPLEVFPAHKFPCSFGYEIKGFQFNESLVEPQTLPYLNRSSQFGVTAAAEALAQSGLELDRIRPERIGVCLGVGVPSPSFDWIAQVHIPKRYQDRSLQRLNRYFPSTLSSTVAGMLGARGGATTVHTACASSGQSIGEAYEMIKYGECDVVMTGGADSMLNVFHVMGFCLLGTLSTRVDDPQHASRPFDVDRDGFVLGEGACMLMLEEEEHAKRRGAEILGEVTGYGVTESAFRITDLHPEGDGPIQAMQSALADAEINPEDIGYLNAHGTATKLNDKVESLAISRCFDERKCDLHVSSSKSMTGHLISAAGAIEFAISMMALQEQQLPPSVNLEKQDPLCRIQLSPTTTSKKSMEHVLSNSVGFGGSNTALIARRYQ